MTTTIWHYVQNQFDNATKGNFKLMNTVNADHIARLQAEQSDPDIAALLARTTPLSDNYNTTYSHWFAVKGIYKGETDRMEGLIFEIGTKIKQWDIQIQVEYLRGTPDYVVILPNGRTPFYEGTMEDRISHVAALAERLDNYPALAALKNDVIAYHTSIKSARLLQQQKEEMLEDASKHVETARIDLAVMMYKNLGVLIDKYAYTPNYITNFWELALISSGGDAGAGPTPPTPVLLETILFSSKQNPAGTVSMSLIGADGEQVLFKWKDGTADTSVVVDSVTFVVAMHLYSSIGNYNIEATGVAAAFKELLAPDCKLSAINIPDTINFRRIDLMNNLLTSFFLPLSCVDMLNLQLNNNELDQASINQVLMQLAANGLSNGSVNLGGGSNAAPSGQGIAAMNQLIARGWTVITN